MAGFLVAAGTQQGVCYALSKAESRAPANLKDVEGLLFVSSRPAEGVRNEISFVMNFDLKEDVEHQAVIGEERFALVAKGQNMWLKNPAEEQRMLDAMRRGASPEIKGTSKRGNPTTDKYSLAADADRQARRRFQARAILCRHAVRHAPDSDRHGGCLSGLSWREDFAVCGNPVL